MLFNSLTFFFWIHISEQVTVSGAGILTEMAPSMAFSSLLEHSNTQSCHLMNF